MDFQEKLDLVKHCAEELPGITVVHDIDGFKPLYMSSNGLKILGVTFEELLETGEDYTKKFFNQDFMEDFLPGLKRLLENEKDHETFCFFHQVLTSHQQFEWYISSVRAFHFDGKNRPTHIIATAFKINDFERAARRAERLLEERMFCKENFEKFKSLTEREKEILRLVALGKTSAEIGEILNISIDTVNSHRMNIKQKLSISSGYDFADYALSFDLI